MFYPKFIKNHDCIGICAPSKGVGSKLNAFDVSMKRLEESFRVKETSSVRVNNVRSNTAIKRAEEFNSLFRDDSVDMVMCASGGDFLFEVLPYIDWKFVCEHPKWFMGYSDPTSILYTLTTKYDIATLYGMNGGSFDMEHEYVDIALDMIQGDLMDQIAYEKYQSTDNFLIDNPVYDLDTDWKTNQEIHVSGRCIGGCLEVIKDIMGTEYDGTSDFIERYKEDGFIWYFDNFAMNPDDMYRTLLQMKYAGYFKYTKAVMVGRVCFEGKGKMTYLEALDLALGDIPYVMDADIGHIIPRFTLINGAMMTLDTYGNKGKISFELK